MDNMDFLDNNEDFDLELPQTSELSVDLFSDTLEKYAIKKKGNDKGNNKDEIEFNIDQFLMDHNFQYSSLDTLIRSISSLKDESLRNLLNAITQNYNSYIDFFKTYDKNDNEILLELQRTKLDIENFTKDLNQLLTRDIPYSKEKIVDICEYLKELDKLSNILMEHDCLAQRLSIGKKMSKTLHEMCGLDDFDETLCSDLIEKINDHIVKCNSLFIKFEDLHSPFLNHLYNDYQGLIQEFQVSLKIITDKCLGDVATYPQLSKVLVSLINKVQS